MITNLIPFVSNQICYTKFSLPLKLKKAMSQLSLLNLSFYWDCLFSSFTSYWWKIYLETPFLALSETQIWRGLRPVTYNGYGYQHQKHSAEKRLVHCLSPELKTNTNCLPGLLLFSTAMFSLTLDFKRKILNILWPSKGK